MEDEVVSVSALQQYLEDPASLKSHLHVTETTLMPQGQQRAFSAEPSNTAIL